MRAKAVKIKVDETHTVSGLLLAPTGARVCYVLAHGAGAGMTHAFMEAIAQGLAERGIATLRFQFPYMEAGSKRPDAPKLAQVTVRAAVAAAEKAMPGVALVAGGKSFGGRMASQAQATEPLTGVRGLAFFGFPLHPAGAPSTARGTHLADVRIPMLFLQGTRDALADLAALRGVLKGLGKRATLHTVAEADHSFHVPARTGRKDSEVMDEILDVFAKWAENVAS